MRDQLFCYGTLQASEIMGSITGLSLTGEKCLLRGYSCYRVKNAVYPGIIRNAGENVSGTLYKGIHGAALEKLDRFEGELYERQQLKVIRDKGQSTVAWCYVIKAGCQHLLTREPWIYEEYEEQFLARFRSFRDV